VGRGHADVDHHQFGRFFSDEGQELGGVASQERCKRLGTQAPE
jgi:hypothetical protein